MVALDEIDEHVDRHAHAAGRQLWSAIIVFLIAAAPVAMLAWVGDQNKWITPPALHVLFAEIILFIAAVLLGERSAKSGPANEQLAIAGRLYDLGKVVSDFSAVFLTSILVLFALVKIFPESSTFFSNYLWPGDSNAAGLARNLFWITFGGAIFLTTGTASWRRSVFRKLSEASQVELRLLDRSELLVELERIAEEKRAEVYEVAANTDAKCDILLSFVNAPSRSLLDDIEQLRKKAREVMASLDHKPQNIDVEEFWRLTDDYDTIRDRIVRVAKQEIPPPRVEKAGIAIYQFTNYLTRVRIDGKILRGQLKGLRKTEQALTEARLNALPSGNGADGAGGGGEDLITATRRLFLASSAGFTLYGLASYVLLMRLEAEAFGVSKDPHVLVLLLPIVIVFFLWLSMSWAAIGRAIAAGRLDTARLRRDRQKSESEDGSASAQAADVEELLQPVERRGNWLFLWLPLVSASLLSLWLFFDGDWIPPDPPPADDPVIQALKDELQKTEEQRDSLARDKEQLDEQLTINEGLLSELQTKHNKTLEELNDAQLAGLDMPSCLPDDGAPNMPLILLNLRLSSEGITIIRPSKERMGRGAEIVGFAEFPFEEILKPPRFRTVMQPVVVASKDCRYFVRVYGDDDALAVTERAQLADIESVFYISGPRVRSADAKLPY